MTTGAMRELPAGWAWATVEEWGELQGGVQKQPKRTPRNNAFPFLRVANVLRGKVDLREIHQIELFGDELQRLRLEAGDLLIVEGNGSPSEIGRMAVWPGSIPDCVHQNHIIRVRPVASISSKYIEAFWNSPEGRVAITDVASSTSGLYTLSVAKVSRLSVPLAPSTEQRRIVATIETQFTRLDAAVAALQRARANLKRYRAAVLKAAVESRLVPTEAELAHAEGVKAASGETYLAQLLDGRRAAWEANHASKTSRSARKATYVETGGPRTLPELPPGWAAASVEQLTPAHRPCAYGVLQPGPDLPDGVPFVRVGDVDEGKIDIAGLKRIDPSIAGQYPRTRLQGGEVLITLVGAIGRTAVVPGSLAGANTARAVGVIPLIEGVDPHWVEIWFRNPERVLEMTSKAHEVARKTLNLEDVREAVVALPPLQEQRRIVAEVERRLSVLDELESAVVHSLKRAERLRQAILKRAFEGRLVPQDPDDEPASVLLERIRAERSTIPNRTTKRSSRTFRRTRTTADEAISPRLF